MRAYLLYFCVFIVALCAVIVIDAIFRPKSLGPIFKKLGKYRFFRIRPIRFICRRKIIIPLFLLIGAASLVACFYIPKSYSATKIEKLVAKSASEKVFLSEKSENQKQSESPSSGALDYQAIIEPQTQLNNIYPRFSYYTTERRGERLIELNDNIINELKQAGLINDKTTDYSISYFNNKVDGTDYFSKINDPKISSAEKLRLMSGYVAMMAYNSKMNVNQLVRLNNGETIKKY